MATIELDNPIDIPSLWEFILVAGVRSPGLAEVSGADRTYDWDTKTAPGTEGATSTYKGKGPVTFTVKLTFWDSEQIDQWNRFRSLLKYESVKSVVKPVDIIHPALSQNGIGAAVTKKIGQLTHDGLGLYSVTVEFLEYFPPKKKDATQTPKGAVAKKFVDGFTADFFGPNKGTLLDRLSGSGNPATASDQSAADRAKVLAELSKFDKTRV